MFQIGERLHDDYCDLETVIEDNKRILELVQKDKLNYILIDDKYEIDIDLER